MNPRELMGRLGPSTVNFDIGRGGGKPDLTNQDVAALRRHRLRGAVTALVTPELQRQQRRLAEARTDLGLAEVCMGWGGAATAEQPANPDAAQQRLSRVKAQC